MVFLYPAFLWALLALSIPLIVHLFNFRRTRKVYFSNTRFIRQVQEATSSKRRLKHLLVLTSRLLFLFFLVMVFAQPVIPAREQLRAGENICIYIDNSYSMSAPLANAQTAFDAALTSAKTVVENFPPDTRYRLLTNDFEPFANSLKTKTQVLDQLAQLRLSGRSRTVQEVVARLNRLGSERETFWISDFQQSTTGQSLNDTTRTYHLVPLRVRAESNIFVDTVFLDNPFAIGGERNKLTVKLRNDGNEDRSQITLRLSLGGLQSGTTTTSLSANSSAEVSFEIAGTTTGAQQAVLSFTDNPISFDNEFYAVLQFAKRVRIQEIKGGSSSSAVAKVFGNREVFDLYSANERNVDYSEVQRADLVVLNEISDIDNALIQVLQDYLSQGGSVLVVPSAEPVLASYRALIPTITLSKQKDFLPLTTPDFNNPFFENVFQERSVQVATPAVRNTIVWGNDRQAILFQQDGTPYLSKLQTMGNVYVLGSPLQASYGSFASNALFVPVMYRMAAYSQRNQQPLYYSLAHPVVNFSGALPTNAVLTMSGVQELTPAQRIVNQQVMLDMSGLEFAQGHYLVKHGNDTVTQLAFNQSKAESLMKRMEDGVLVDFFGGNSKLYETSGNNSSALAETIRATYEGKPLWKYALWMCLFFIAVEIVLLRFLKN